MKTPTIILDMGGVLVTHNRAGCQHALQQFMSADDIYHILGFGNDKPDSLRMRLEKGLISEQEFVKSVLSLSRPGTMAQQVIEAWNSMHAGIPDNVWEQVRLLHESAQNVHLYLFSNTDILHWEHVLDLYADKVNAYFDDVFLSFRCHMMKPDRAIYQMVHQAISADPRDIYFVDDTEVNRLAAQQFVGWHTYANIAELLEKLNFL